ncbi:hypothetical protein KUV23_06095 [Algoriphagus marincola]|uniref:Uncharacterized protein n=1 Tax=Algoriphagus marincola TaxID=264027 RepID=A0ABS7N2H9_9BACT|nr:hypothetical protein [Algoriphagus marincola]MBY5950535.1 hypothetical protein [Algoriphagus marincola]
MLINVDNQTEVKQLKRGVFAVPNLNYARVPPKLIRRKYTTKAILTNLQKKGFGNILNQIFPNDLKFKNDQERIDFLETNIQNNIQFSIKNNFNDKILVDKIFHSIQIWGGNTSRGFYLQDPEKNNFEISIYIEGINYVLEGEIEQAIKTFEGINKMGIAFASKHFSFWSSQLQGTNPEGARQLPILDNLIFNLLYGKANPVYKSYSQYLDDIYGIIQKLNIDQLTVHSLERQLFNFADTPQGVNWKNIRLRTV